MLPIPRENTGEGDENPTLQAHYRTNMSNPDYHPQVRYHVPDTYSGYEPAMDEHGPTMEHFFHEPRENYRHVPGQTVLPLAGGENEYHVRGPQELDKHGNVFIGERINHLYQQYGPFDKANKGVWDRHGETRQISASSVIHTGQSATHTGDHSYIDGPLDPKREAAHVLIHQGHPYMMDGHHRTAEYRGRGMETLPARVLDLDKLHANIDVHPKFGKHSHVDDVVDHMIRHHGVSPNSIGELAKDHRGMMRWHEGSHENFPEDNHVHGQPAHVVENRKLPGFKGDDW
jgi:hypothetical protein